MRETRYNTTAFSEFGRRYEFMERSTNSLLSDVFESFGVKVFVAIVAAFFLTFFLSMRVIACDSAFSFSPYHK